MGIFKSGWIRSADPTSLLLENTYSVRYRVCLRIYPAYSNPFPSSPHGLTTGSAGWIRKCRPCLFIIREHVFSARQGLHFESTLRYSNLLPSSPHGFTTGSALFANIILSNVKPHCSVMPPSNAKVSITPTQYEKSEKNKHLAQLSCRLCIHRNHKSGGGHEISTMITNPIFEHQCNGNIGVKSLGKSLPKISKLARSAAPIAAAAGAPTVAAGLAAVGAVGMLVRKGDILKGKPLKPLKTNRYRLAKKTPSS